MYVVEFDGRPPATAQVSHLRMQLNFSSSSSVSLLLPVIANDPNRELMARFESMLDLLGTSATVKCPLWKFVGVVTGVELRHRSRVCAITIGDALALLALVHDSGVFVDKRLSEIAKAVVPAPCEVAVLGDEDPRIPLAIRHRESALGFLGRLAARYGVALWSSGKAVFLGRAHSEEPRKLRLGIDVRDFEVRSALGLERTSVIGVGYEDHNAATSATWTSPTDEEGTFGAAAAHSRKKWSATDRSHLTGRISDNAMTKARAKGRLEAVSGSRLSVYGATTLPVVPGQELSLDTSGMRERSEPERLLITTVSGDFDLARPDEEQIRYFEASAGELAPGKMSNARPMQVTTAIVEDIDKKKHKARVRFVWDEKQVITPWLRLGTSAWGSEHKMYLPPRRGDTVVVVWDDADDDPIVVASVASGDAAQDPDSEFSFWTTAGQHVQITNGSIVVINQSGSKQSKITIRPSDTQIMTAEGQRISIDSSAISLEHGTGAKVVLGKGGIELTSPSKIVLRTEGGAKLELGGPKVSINGNALEVI